VHWKAAAMEAACRMCAGPLRVFSHESAHSLFCRACFEERDCLIGMQSLEGFPFTIHVLDENDCIGLKIVKKTETVDDELFSGLLRFRSGTPLIHYVLEALRGEQNFISPRIIAGRIIEVTIEIDAYKTSYQVPFTVHTMLYDEPQKINYEVVIRE
jgi:hypothetical protein